MYLNNLYQFKWVRICILYFLLTFCSTFRLNSLISSHFMPRLCSKRTWNSFRNIVLNWSKLKFWTEIIQLSLKILHSYFTHLEIDIRLMNTVQQNRVWTWRDWNFKKRNIITLSMFKTLIKYFHVFFTIFTVFTLIKHSKNKTNSPLNCF